MTSLQSQSIRFPLGDVEIRKVKKIREVSTPIASYEWMSINGNEFSMSVEDVGDFYTRDGNYIEYSPSDDADSASVELFMNGSVYGSILHQRKILPLHGSSFVFNNRGIMFCGDSGAGKSSLTTAFCLKGADFMTDDVTPILFEEEQPMVWPKSGRIKLWDDSLQQLNREKTNLAKIRPDDEKYYFPMNSNQVQSHPLHRILILQIEDTGDVTFEKVQKVEAFSYLHQEIYRREYLVAMPDTEAAYLQQISTICSAVEVLRVKRPVFIPLADMYGKIEEFLQQ